MLALVLAKPQQGKAPQLRVFLNQPLSRQRKEEREEGRGEEGGLRLCLKGGSRKPEGPRQAGTESCPGTLHESAMLRKERRKTARRRGVGRQEEGRKIKETRAQKERGK